MNVREYLPKHCPKCSSPRSFFIIREGVDEKGLHFVKYQCLCGYKDELEIKEKTPHQIDIKCADCGCTEGTLFLPSGWIVCNKCKRRWKP